MLRRKRMKAQIRENYEQYLQRYKKIRTDKKSNKYEYGEVISNEEIMLRKKRLIAQIRKIVNRNGYGARRYATTEKKTSTTLPAVITPGYSAWNWMCYCIWRYTGLT